MGSGDNVAGGAGCTDGTVAGARVGGAESGETVDRTTAGATVGCGV